MKRKIFLQALFSLFLFLGCWGLLAQINWMHLLGISAHFTEEKLGERYWELYSAQEVEETNPRVVSAVKALGHRLCTRNGMNPDSIRIHVLRNSQVNAFAFPNRHLVLYTGLIRDCRNEQELAGVMAHELAHIRQGHVLKKLIAETGLLLLVGATGGGGSEVAMQLAHLLSSTAYDRKQETEADTLAVNYLLNAHIDPQPLADFFIRLSQEDGDIGLTEWVSTHPESKLRAERVVAHSRGRITHFRPVFTKAEWEALKKAVE